jgi:hypothetical protein
MFACHPASQPNCDPGDLPTLAQLLRLRLPVAPLSSADALAQAWACAHEESALLAFARGIEELLDAAPAVF